MAYMRTSLGTSAAAQWRTRLGQTLLGSAERGDAPAVTLALEQGANPGTVDAEGRTGLHYAVHAGCLEAMRVLLRAGCPHGADAQGLTPLQAALDFQQPRCVEELLYTAGPDILQGSSVNLNASLIAVLEVCCDPPSIMDLYVIGLLFEQIPHRSQDEQPEDVRRALMISVSRGWAGGVATLLEAKADPDCVDPKAMRSALELADAILERRISEILRISGASEARGESFVEWATLIASARGDRAALARWLPQSMLDWREPVPSEGKTALMYAAVEGHADVCYALLEARACPALQDNNSLYPWQLAAQRGHHRLSERLKMKMEEFLAAEGSGMLWRMRYPAQGNLPARRYHVWKWPPVDPKPATGGQSVQPAVQTISTSLFVTVVSASNLVPGAVQTTVDCYVKVRYYETEVKTQVIHESNPVFTETFEFADFEFDEEEALIFTVWDVDQTWLLSDGLLGRLDIFPTEYMQRLEMGRDVEIYNHVLKYQVPGSTGDMSLTLKLSMRKPSASTTGGASNGAALGASFF